MSNKRQTDYILKTEIQILDSLIERSKSFYDFTRKEKIASAGSILKALSNLDTGRYIIHSEPGSRNRISYSLSLEGLLYVLMHNQKTWEESWDKFNLIVKNHSDKFPLILGKMQYFKKKLIHEEIKGRFLVAVWVNKKYGEFSSMNYDALMSLFSIVDKNFKEKIEQKIENNLLEIVEIIRRETIKRINVDVFLGFPWLGTPVDQQKFLAKVKGDVDIDNFITTYLNDTSKEYATYVENLEAWKTWWASI